MMDEDEKLSEQEKIEQENLFIQSQIILKGGIIGGSNNLPPEIENQFLKNIMAFEDAEQKPIFEILGIKRSDFLSSSKLTDIEIDQKLNQIIEILAKNEIELNLVADVPNRIVYNYLIEDYLFDVDNMHPVGIGGWVIDGCSGDCPSCFQIDYCSSKDDIWSPDELSAEIERRKENHRAND